MYCTTDPLNDTDVDESGDPVFHRIPTMVSTDLVNWTYVGDAFPLDGGDHPGLDRRERRVLGSRGRLLQRHRSVLPVRHRHRDDRGGRRIRHLSVATAPSAWRSVTAPPVPWDVHRRAGRSAASRPDRRAVLVLLDLRPGRPRRHRRGRGHPVLRLVLRRHLRHRGELLRDRRDRRDAGPGRRHPDRDRQPVRGRQRRPPGRLLLPVRLGHQLLQRRVDRLQRLRRTLDQPVRPVRGPRGQLLPRGGCRRHAVPHHERQSLGRDRPQHRLRGRGLGSGGRSTTPSTRRTPSSTSPPGSPSGPPCSTRSTGCTAGRR